MIPQECPDCHDYNFAGIQGLCPACQQEELEAYHRWKEEDIPWVEPLSP